MHKSILAFAALLGGSLASVYTENMYFPRISKKEVASTWQDMYGGMDLQSVKFSCSKFEHNGGKSFRYAPEWDGKKSTGTPKTFVVVPNSKGGFTLDVKYADYTSVFDTYDGDRSPKCYVIPPYKPVMYMYVSGPKMDVYTLNELEDGDETSESCPGFDIEMVKKCQVVGPPVSYDLPVHSFFLTGSKAIDRDDVTMYTALTVDRLVRLKEMAEAWKGPISAAIAIRSLSEIPMILKVWSESKDLRMYADIHLVYDDQYSAMKTNLPPVPINYIRSVSLMYTRTKLVFYVEADFVPSKNLRSIVTNLIPTMLSTPKTVYAVIALMCGKNINAAMIPSSKDELYKFNEGKKDKEDTIVRFPYVSHSGYKFAHWKTATEMYDVAASSGFEPYYIGHRSYPLFDEVFFGCGWDKVSHMAELSRSGYKIKVLPDGFIAHLSSDGMGQPWCRGWESDVRTSIKQLTFRSRTGKTLNRNTHMMPWFNVDFTEAGDAVVAAAAAPQCETVEKTGESKKMETSPSGHQTKEEAIEALKSKHASEIEQIKKEAEEKGKAEKEKMEKKINELQAKLDEYEKSAAPAKSASNATLGVTEATFAMLGVAASGMCVILYKVHRARHRREHNHIRGRV